MDAETNLGRVGETAKPWVEGYGGCDLRRVKEAPQIPTVARQTGSPLSAAAQSTVAVELPPPRYRNCASSSALGVKTQQ